MAAFLSRVSQEMSLGLVSASTSTIHTESLGKAPRFLECETRVLCVGVPWHRACLGSFRGVLRLSAGWRMTSGLLGGTGPRYSGCLYWSVNFFDIVPRIKPKKSHRVSGQRAGAVSGDTETKGLCCIFPLVVPLVCGCKAIHPSGVGHVVAALLP